MLTRLENLGDSYRTVTWSLELNAMYFTIYVICYTNCYTYLCYKFILEKLL